MGVIMKNKVNYTGGSAGGGSSTLADLEDVELTTPTDGQALVYDAENDLWINGGVVGSGGGSAKYSETVLWSGTQSAIGTITLSESVKNFSIIMLMISSHPSNTNYYKIPWYILVSEITDYTTTYQFEPFGVRGAENVNDKACMLSLHFTNETTISIDEVSNGSQAKATLLKVIGIKWETMQTALIYSTEEREVGVWKDGKPLYQKTLYYNEHLYGNVDKDVASLNIDTCVDISGMTGEHSQYGYCTTFGYARQSSSANVTAIYNSLSKKLQLRFGSDYSSSAYFNGCNITLLYTKTTDTAGSGIWTTTGEYAHHYSTDEKVVGTWIDGKPLYERVIIDSRSGGFSTGEYEIYSDASTYHLIPNGLQGMLYNSAGSHYHVPWIGNNNSTSLHKNSSGKIVLTVRNDTYNNYILEVIIRYTKTTD